MKKIILICAALLFGFTEVASASPVRTSGNFGIGLGSGTLANGLSGKYFLDSEHALQLNLGAFGGLGASGRWGHWRGFGLSADYLYELPTITRVKDVMELGWNVGGGVGLAYAAGAGFNKDGSDYSDAFGLAASFVLGLELNFDKVPLDLVIEYRPSFLFVPYVGVDFFDITAHIRYYLF